MSVSVWKREKLLVNNEDRTPLNLLSLIASLDPQKAFKSPEYKTLFDFIEERCGIIYSIKELKKEKQHGYKQKKRSRQKGRKQNSIEFIA